MKRKYSFIILCMFVMFFGNVEIHSFAKDKNVKDCIETDEDCLEEVEQPAEGLQSTNEDSIENIQSTSLIFNVIKMIVALLLVLALIYVLLIFIKKRNKLTQQVKVLDNLGGISVGPNKSIQLVRIGEKVYMIGVGDTVELLQEITDASVIDDLLNQEEHPIKPMSFLKQKLRRNSSNDENQSAEHPFTDTLQQELNKLKSNRHQMIQTSKAKDDENV
ncbi:MAG TPA: flagellar biosynthetic protein FliO [Pseudogracilibacillus sp.]|nr:flagellar biosynthetic protein FliO [Pseudogracilibacillus sp.]